MRKTVAAMTVAVLLGSLSIVGAPALATHGGPPYVVLLEGVGQVCEAVDQTLINNHPGFNHVTRCTHSTDSIWAASPKNDGTFAVDQGLYWPGFGPPAYTSFTITNGPLTSPPTTFCRDSFGGACENVAVGNVTVGAAGFGAYCGASSGEGWGTTTASNGDVSTTHFGWVQSGATVLPLQGEVTSGPNAGATVIGFTSSRGLKDAGNCGVTKATNGFQTEGMLVVF